MTDTTFAYRQTVIASSWTQDINNHAYRPTSTLAALRALQKTGPGWWQCRGYYQPGDGGDGVFYLNPNDTTSADNGGTIIVDTSGGRWYRGTVQAVSVKSFGAKGDGATDDTAAINRAIAWCIANNQPLYFPAGTYIVSSSLVITQPIQMFGVAMGVSIIKNSGPTSTPVIHLSGQAAFYSYLHDFTVTSANAMVSGGFGVQVDGGQYFNLQRLEVINTFSGIAVPAGTAGSWIRDCFVHNITGIGYSTDAANMLISGCYAVNCGSHGFANTTNSGNSAGLTMSDCTGFNNGGDNFVFQGNATFNLIDVAVSNCVASASPNGNGFAFNTFGKYITCSNLFCELAGMSTSDSFVSAQDGIYFSANNLGAISLNNLHVIGASASGLHMDCGHWSLTGGYFVANNAQGTPSNSGVVIGVAGAVTAWSIAGINTSVPSGTSDSQAYGINSFTSGNVGIVTGCVLHGTTAAFQNTGSTSTFVNNLSV